MASPFPTAFDQFPNPPAPGEPLTGHAARHASITDALTAVQTTIGVSGSADPDSLQYRVAQAAAAAGSAASALAAHEAAADPHAVYTTQPEVDARVAALAPAETAATLGAVISGATPKTSPADADKLGLSDSASGGALRGFTWGSVRAALDGFFARLAGAPGGQTLNGGAGAGDSLTLNSTSHATKGSVIIGGLAYLSQTLQRLGIGVSSPTARVHIQGGAAAAGSASLKIDAGSPLSTPEDGAVERTADGIFWATPSAAVGRRRVATDYCAAGGAAGFPNGCCELRSNVGFSALSFDQGMTRDACGAFVAPLTSNGAYLGDVFPINARLSYRVACSIGAGEADGTLWSAANRQFVGIQFLDRKLRAISRHMAQAMPGTLTTLASPLNPGDSSITVTSASGWASSSGSRHFAWGPYNDGETTYPSGGYSRNTSREQPGFSAEAWSSVGFIGNTAALVAPWTGPALPAGTPVWNVSESGGTFWYCLMASAAAASGWTDLEAVISRAVSWQSSQSCNIPAGTAFCRFVLLCNYHGSPDTRIRLAGLSVIPVAPANMPAAIGVGGQYRVKIGTELPANGLAVEGSVGIGTPSPTAKLQVQTPSGPHLRLAYDAATFADMTVGSTGILKIAAPLAFRPAAAMTPAANGDLAIEATSNTSLTFRLRGSDGIVRSASLTLT